MQIEFEIIKMRPASAKLETGSEVVAMFDVDIFPFKIWQAHVRKRPSGDLFVALPGRKMGGTSIASPELIEAIRAEGLAVYRERFDGART
jgi:UDP-N-acetylmuramyl pentapeptide synthase